MCIECLNLIIEVFTIEVFTKLLRFMVSHTKVILLSIHDKKEYKFSYIKIQEKQSHDTR